jgi:MoaA/NifB/PqqE/SkfB family radical SAM enzyme
MLLTPEVSRRLVGLRIAEISISLEGVSAAVCEWIRAGARFERVLENVQGLVEAKRRAHSRLPRVRLAAVATAKNLGELPALVEMGHRLGVDKVAVTCFKPIAAALADWVPEPEPLAAAAAEAGGRARALGLDFAAEFAIVGNTDGGHAGHSSQRCLWPWLSVNITLDGSLTPCSYVPRPDGWGLGNLLERPFTELWNGEGYRALRRRLRLGDVMGLACASCRDRV